MPKMHDINVLLYILLLTSGLKQSIMYMMDPNVEAYRIFSSTLSLQEF